MKLEMIRGINDEFYYALKAKGSVGDSLHSVKISMEDEKMIVSDENVPAPYTGEILALELDPFLTNDVEKHVESSDNDLDGQRRHK